MAVLLQSEGARILEGRADTVLLEFSRTSRALGLNFIGPDYLVPTYGRINEDTDPILSYVGTTVKLSSAAHDFTFQKSDGSITDYTNRQVLSLLSDAGAPLQDTRDVSHWTKDQVLKFATPFRDLMIQGLKVKLGAPFVQFEQNPSNTVTKSGKLITKWRPGNWMISWPRVDEGSHLFYGDHLNISLSEKYGLFSAYISVFTPFSERKGPTLVREKALSHARSHIVWTSFTERYFSSFSKDPYETIVGDKLLSSELIVVIPNHVSSLTPAFSGKPSARLAWSFWFKPIHKAPPSSPTYDDRFAVWVDAYTGEIIGGDAML